MQNKKVLCLSFWKDQVIKTFLVFQNKIHLTENGESLIMDLEITKILNDFFSKYSKNVDIIKHSNNKTATLTVILKFRSHPRIVAIRNQCKKSASFSFANVYKKEVEHLIFNQDVEKVSQSSVVILRIVKENIDILSYFLCDNTGQKSNFPLRISSVNVTISAVSCGCGNIHWRNP